MSAKTLEKFFFPIEIEQRISQHKERMNKISNNIQTNLNILKTFTSTDPKEQLFIDLFEGLIAKIDHDEYPNHIFFLDKTNKTIAYYYLRMNIFLCSYKNIWLPFKYRFNIGYGTTALLIKIMLENHLKLKNIYAEPIGKPKLDMIDEHLNQYKSKWT